MGLDSKIVVWSGHNFDRLKTISNHQSHVKGLTFDPANKYFATASDDRSVKIFRFTPPGPNSGAHDQMNNFILEKTITAPFVASPLTTYFRRCSWSPDGNHIAAANAVNGPVSSVAIINRGSWDGDIHLIGHEGPVEVCAFSPRLFSKHSPENVPRGPNGQTISNLVTVIACAGQDKALSVWITSNPRPLLITQELAMKSISDLAWSPDGQSLFVASLDGRITAVRFENGELGHGVSMEENEKALAKFGAGRKGAGFIEGPSGLLLEQMSKEEERKGVEGRMGALMGSHTNGVESVGVSGASQLAHSTNLTVNGTKNGLDVRNETPSTRDDANLQGAKDPHAAKLERLKGRITITKDGKKRIAPLLVSSSGAGESSLPRTQLLSSNSNGQAAVNDIPKTILDLSKPFDGLPKGGILALLLGNKRKLVSSEGDEEGRNEKRLAVASQNGSIPILSNTVDGLVPSHNALPKSGQVPTPDFIRPAVINPSLVTSQLRLAVPKIRSVVVSSLTDISSGAPQANGSVDRLANGNAATTSQNEAMFEAHNPSGPSPTGRQEDREPVRLAVTKRGQPIWQDFLPKSVLLVTGSSHFWAAACEDGSIYIWTPAGRRMTSAIILESQPVILESKDSWLFCVTAVGMCYVWDIKNQTSPHPPVSLAPILDIATHSLQAHTTKGPAITSAHINSEGRILVTLTNGDGYVYSSTMYVWQRLSEVWWAVGSQYWNTVDASVGNIDTSGSGSDASSTAIKVSSGVISFLERNTTNETLLRGRAYFLQRLIKQLLPREGFEGFESSVSIAHLENRLSAAMMLGARDDFRTYLFMYAKRLGAEGLKARVEELMRGLLGDVYELPEQNGRPQPSTELQHATTDRTWDDSKSTICGWPRKELLRGVVLILGKQYKNVLSVHKLTCLGKHRDLQRITVPYAKMLGVTENSVEGDNVMEI